MKFAIHSDIHHEFGSNPINGYTDKTLKQLRDSYILIAGDISPNPQAIKNLLLEYKLLTDKKVFFVAGNHDYYYSDVIQRERVF
jgi:predicted MPP superfamily phosphohydrolase